MSFSTFLILINHQYSSGVSLKIFLKKLLSVALVQKKIQLFGSTLNVGSKTHAGAPAEST